jgi:hypothetical protein
LEAAMHAPRTDRKEVWRQFDAVRLRMQKAAEQAQ